MFTYLKIGAVLAVLAVAVFLGWKYRDNSCDAADALEEQG